MPRKIRLSRPDTSAVAVVAEPPVELSLQDRRALAFARVWPLLPTSIPTRDLTDSYLDDVLVP